MSTRGIIGYRTNGKDSLFYNQQDSYPSELGLRVLAMISAGNTEPTEPDDEDEDGTEFAGQSMFCLYGYVINLDDQTLEYYRGLNTDPEAPGRYTSTGRKTDIYEKVDYFGIRLAKVIPFDVIMNTEGEDRLKLFEE